MLCAHAHVSINMGEFKEGSYTNVNVNVNAFVNGHANVIVKGIVNTPSKLPVKVLHDTDHRLNNAAYDARLTITCKLLWNQMRFNQPTHMANA